MFQTLVVEEVKTHILCSLSFFPENREIRDVMWKNIGRAGQATDDNLAEAYCMLDI